MDIKQIASSIDIGLTLSTISEKSDIVYHGLKFDETKGTIDVFCTKTKHIKKIKMTFTLGSSSVGRTSDSGSEGRGFDPSLPR